VQRSRSHAVRLFITCEFSTDDVGLHSESEDGHDAARETRNDRRRDMHLARPRGVRGMGSDAKRDRSGNLSIVFSRNAFARAQAYARNEPLSIGGAAHRPSCRRRSPTDSFRNVSLRIGTWQTRRYPTARASQMLRRPRSAKSVPNASQHCGV
jgi:hypothetical protein